MSSELRGDYTRAGPEWIEAIAQLMYETAPDFTPLYEKLRNLPALEP